MKIISFIITGIILLQTWNIRAQSVAEDALSQIAEEDIMKDASVSTKSNELHVLDLTSKADYEEENFTQEEKTALKIAADRKRLREEKGSGVVPDVGEIQEAVDNTNKENPSGYAATEPVGTSDGQTNGTKADEATDNTKSENPVAEKAGEESDSQGTDEEKSGSGNTPSNNFINSICNNTDSNSSTNEVLINVNHQKILTEIEGSSELAFDAQYYSYIVQVVYENGEISGAQVTREISSQSIKLKPELKPVKARLLAFRRLNNNIENYDSVKKDAARQKLESIGNVMDGKRDGYYFAELAFDYNSLTDCSAMSTSQNTKDLTNNNISGNSEGQDAQAQNYIDNSNDISEAKPEDTVSSGQTYSNSYIKALCKNEENKTNIEVNFAKILSDIENNPTASFSQQYYNYIIQLVDDQGNLSGAQVRNTGVDKPKITVGLRSELAKPTKIRLLAFRRFQQDVSGYTNAKKVKVQATLASIGERMPDSIVNGETFIEDGFYFADLKINFDKLEMCPE